MLKFPAAISPGGTMSLITRKFIHHTLAIILILLQAACLDYYLVVLNQEAYGLAFIGWVVADLLVVVVFSGTWYFGARYVRRKLAGIDETNKPADFVQGQLRHMGILPYGWLGWLVYSGVLVAKIITAFKTFGPNLAEEHIGAINLMEFTIGGTAGVFMLMLEGAEHLTTNAQKHYVRWMQHYVLLEIVDCVEFLTLLFAAAEDERTSFDELFTWTLQTVILSFACINLLAPALALYRLSSRHNRHPETRNHFFLSQTLVGTVFGNVPYLIVRVYLWNNRGLVTGLFTMKNIIGIVQDTRELIAYIQDAMKGRLDGSDSSLNGKSTEGEQERDKQDRDKAAEAAGQQLLKFPSRQMAYIDEI